MADKNIMTIVIWGSEEGEGGVRQIHDVREFEAWRHSQKVLHSLITESFDNLPDGGKLEVRMERR